MSWSTLSSVARLLSRLRGVAGRDEGGDLVDHRGDEKENFLQVDYE